MTERTAYQDERKYYKVRVLRWDWVMVLAKDEIEAKEMAPRCPGVIQLGCEAPVPAYDVSEP